MGRAPCCDKSSVKKGPWSPEEDAKLKDFIEKFGTGGNWIALPQKAGLKRCGKSCRLRWLNYLRPNIKHGDFSDEEDRIICTLYANIGSRWSIIAAQLPGRTDNDIKNYWNTKLKKKLIMGITNIPSKPSPPLTFPGNNSNLIIQAQLSHQNPHHSSFYFQPLSSDPQSFNIKSPNYETLSLPTPQYSSYFQQNQEGGLGLDLVDNSQYYYPGKSDVANSMLIFGGNNETSCTSSSDGSCSQVSYGAKDHGHVIKQEEDQYQMAVAGFDHFQGFVSENFQKLLIENQWEPLNAAGLIVDDQNKLINGNNIILPNRELGYCDLDEEVKKNQKLVAGTNNYCNSLLFNHDNDENKTHEERKKKKKQNGLYCYYY
ncbi:hypothetical protein OROMI_011642 [Orobanche minor]